MLSQQMEDVALSLNGQKPWHRAYRQSDVIVLCFLAPKMDPPLLASAVHRFLSASVTVT